jgi:hypothetical protein
MNMMDKFRFIQASPPANMSGAAMTAKYVSLKNYNHLTIVITTGAWAAGTAAVTLVKASDVSATDAETARLQFMWSDEVTSNTFVKNTVTANTFNLDTANKQYIIEVDAADLKHDATTPFGAEKTVNFDCVTLAVATPGVNIDLYGVEYILSEPRYPDVSPLTD